MIRYIMLAYALCLMAVSSAAVIDFSYNTEGKIAHGFGYGKAETYDVAILIDEPSLNGTEIKGITVELPGGEAISEISGWLSKELSLKRENGVYVNVPDIMSASGSINDGVMRVMFDSPIVIDGPVYAGYTFTVNELNEATEKPVMIVDNSNMDGLYIHTSKSKLKWSSVSESAGGISSMKVILEGDFKDNSAAFVNPGQLICSLEDMEVEYSIKVSNHGLNPIDKIAYKYSFEGVEYEKDVTFDKPIAANWGACGVVELTLPQPTLVGDNELDIEITSVNGAVNNDVNNHDIFLVHAYPFIPVNRPLVEEYTGFWCGWCPRGYVALETMRDLYPDRFIGVAYHSGDPLEFIRNFPNSTNSYPDGYINRTRVNLGEIYTIWPGYTDVLTPAEVKVAIEWADEASSTLKATSYVRFMEDIDEADFGISYILVADGLSDPSWEQTNAYAPAEGEEPKEWSDMPGKWGELFTHGKSVISGLVYNDVALALRNADEFPTSIPSEITAGVIFTHNCEFNVDELRNTSKDTIELDKSKLRVIATVIDRKTGKPINCNTSLYPENTNAISLVTNEAVIVNTEWYTLNGLRVATPSEGMGILIRKDLFSDGISVATKQIF